MSGANVELGSEPRSNLCLAESEGIFGELHEVHRQQLSKIMRLRHFKSGREIFHQDDVSSVFSIIMSGTVKLSRMLPDGRLQAVCFLFESDCLGELFHGQSRDTAECLTDVVICCFPRRSFETLLKEEPELEHHLFLQASESLDETRNWLFALGRKKAIERVATFLLWLLSRQKEASLGGDSKIDETIIFCPFSRQDIADFLGLTMETVSRQFSRLRDLGVIRLHANRNIGILDLQELQAHAG